MESSNSVGEWRSVKNFCRCCLTVGCYKDIKNRYYFCGKEEIYEIMLMETLNIQIQEKPDKTSSLICESCIGRLRDATDFKRMVAQTEHILNMYQNETKLENHCGNQANIDLQNSQNMSTSVIKLESDTDFLDDNYQENDDLFYGDDDNEILANIKLDITKSKEIPKHCKRKRIKNDNDPKKRRRTKESIDCKEKCESDRLKQVKLTERRGNGPILRENSLKLIKNSTLCVFQWNKSRYRCFCCKEPFSDFNLLRDHTNKEHSLKHIEKKIIIQQNTLVKCEISTLNCKICNSEIENLIDLRNHLVNQHKIEFFLNEDLLVPFRIQNGDFTCQICRENFTVFRFLNIHMNKHYQKQVCHICGAGFSNLVFLNLHKTRYHKVLKCETCELTFSNRSDKKMHDIKTHGVKVERKLRFPCPYCDERFLQENLKVMHLVEKHGLKKPEHKCPNCPKTFITKSLCNGHNKYVHLKEKYHECQTCHKCFYTKSDLSRHYVTHTGAKNFSCSICSTNFATKDSLRRHMKRTHGAG